MWPMPPTPLQAARLQAARLQASRLHKPAAKLQAAGRPVAQTRLSSTVWCGCAVPRLQAARLQAARLQASRLRKPAAKLQAAGRPVAQDFSRRFGVILQSPGVVFVVNPSAACKPKAAIKGGSLPRGRGSAQLSEDQLTSQKSHPRRQGAC